MLFVLALPDTASAKKKKPMKKAQPVFTTDWNNSDSLFYNFEQKYEQQNWTLALRISDSVLFRKVQFDSDKLVDHQLKRVGALAAAKRKAEAMQLLQQMKSQVPDGTDSTGSLRVQIIDAYKAMGENDSALIEVERLHLNSMQRLNEKVGRLNENLLAQKSEIESLSETNAAMRARNSQLNIVLWLSIGFALLFASFGLAALLKNRKLKKRQASQREQMIHTQTQIEKAFDEEERITAEIKKMKEQVARNEAEKNLLKQNVKESTGETLPLLKSQLEAIIRENKEAIPVESYMQLQNTITRFNKQMRDVAGLE